MKYIVYNKETLKIMHIFDKEPVLISSNLSVARTESVPQGDILTLDNIEQKTEKYIEIIPQVIIVKDEETGEEYTDYTYEEVEKEREYFTCDVIGAVDEKKNVRNNISKLKNWFNNNYRMYNEMLTRRANLSIEKSCVDKVRNKTYNTLNDLYLEAENVVEEINQLEEMLKI